MVDTLLFAAKKLALLDPMNLQLLLFRMQWQSPSLRRAGKFKSHGFSTCEKNLTKSREISSSKNKDLKPPRMSTCGKIEGVAC
jgi:hypothetical protein